MNDAGHHGVAVGVQAAYDAVAQEYADQFYAELDGKPLDRALLMAFADLTRSGPIADVGCGPGHITQFLAQHHRDVIGVDLSPGMIAVARERAPELGFDVGSMLDLPAADGSWAGVVSLYSIIHLTVAERATAFAEFARTIRSDGWLLVAFHIDSPDFAAGQVNHLTSWLGRSVDFDGYFIDPADVLNPLRQAGFTLVAQLQRQPTVGSEYPSRRCYLLCQRTA